MNISLKSGLVIALAATLMTSGMAQTKMSKKPTATKCPICHMALSSKKTKDNPVAVRLKKGGKVMYCCAGCKMPASVLVKSKGK